MLESNQLIMFVFICVLIWNISVVYPQLRALYLYYTLTFSVLCPLSYVLLELVETERDYVRDLGSVVEVKEDKNRKENT